ncbi:CCCH tandem zinc finger protein [Schizosaccharomyces cryophilus OY26]|uniref:CCCH tandem zinc finger protein n=1 Tax=Schizosaccharomyces cryophilus (strain OY26 / ATCC MYA-4695 / CBS 11777 / NBRC 106824 / NRRL Y48691) TaxID=653667 RepID=S9W780_SCHCR|nr:CCCH tandem zinc finger protein [Schizosaccharomyces cryophilus OY26]EPY53755.1 CCCH tandem zinc finger protein [Schizosaccharomyces cryophilus OY26]
MVYSPVSRPQVPLTFRQWPPYDYKTDPLTIPRFPSANPLQNNSSMPTPSSLLDTYGSSLLSKSANTLGSLKPASNAVLSPDETFPSTVMPQYRSMDVGTPRSPDADGWPWHLTSSNSPQGYAWPPTFTPNGSTNHLHTSSRNLNDYPSPISSLESLPSKSSVGSSGLDYHTLPSSFNDDTKPTAFPLNMAGVPLSDASSQPSFAFAQNSVDRVFNPKPKLYYPSKSMTNVHNSIAKPALSRQSYSSGSIPLKSSLNTAVSAQPSALSNQISPVVGSPVLNSSKFSVSAPRADQLSPELQQLKQTNVPSVSQRPRAATPGSNNSSTTSTGKRALYKTEPCKNWQTTGNCRYGNKCQFAHGEDELKEPPRHPKYKSEPCRSFMLYGYCPYGLRCCFLHDEQGLINSQQNNIQEAVNADIK